MVQSQPTTCVQRVQQTLHPEAVALRRIPAAKANLVQQSFHSSLRRKPEMAKHLKHAERLQRSEARYPVVFFHKERVATKQLVGSWMVTCPAQVSGDVEGT